MANIYQALYDEDKKIEEAPSLFSNDVIEVTDAFPSSENKNKFLSEKKVIQNSPNNISIPSPLISAISPLSKPLTSTDMIKIPSLDLSKSYNELENNLLTYSTDGNIQQVTTLLESSEVINTNIVDKKGATPLIHISKHEIKTSLLENFLAKKANLNAQAINGVTALHQAAYHGHLSSIKFFLANGAVIKSDKLNNSPIDCAAERGHWDIVNYIIDEVKYSEESVVNAKTLHLTIMSYNEEMLIKLLNIVNIKKAINHQNNFGYSYLIQAAQRNLLEAQSALLSHGIDIEIKCYRGWSALFWATVIGHVDSVLILVRAGASLETRNSELLTPLDYAISLNNIRMATLLLQLGASIHHSSFDIATQKDSHDCIDLMNHYITIRRIKTFTGAVNAAGSYQINGNKNDEKSMFYWNSEARDEMDCNYFSFFDEKKEKAQMINSFALDMGVYSEEGKEKEMSDGALLRTAIKNLDHKSVFSYYLNWDDERWRNSQKDVDSKGRSAIMWAFRAGRFMHIEVLSFFDPSCSPLSDNDEKSLMGFAASSEFVPSLELLIGSYPDWKFNKRVNWLEISKNSPLNFACSSIKRWFYVNFPQIGLEKRLLKYDEQILPRISGDSGLNSLMVACSCSDIDACVELTKDINTERLSYESKNGFTPLNIASQLKNSELVRLFCERIPSDDAKILLEKPNVYGLSPAMVATHITSSEDPGEHKTCICKVFSENNLSIIPPAFHLFNAPIYASDYSQASELAFSSKLLFSSLLIPFIGFSSLSKRFRCLSLGYISQIIWFILFACTFIVAFFGYISTVDTQDILEFIFSTWIVYCIVFLIPWFYCTGRKIRQWQEIEDCFEHQEINFGLKNWHNYVAIFSQIWLSLSLFSLSFYSLHSDEITNTRKFFLDSGWQHLTSVTFLNFDHFTMTFSIICIIAFIYIFFVSAGVHLIASLSWPDTFWYKNIDFFSIAPDFFRVFPQEAPIDNRYHSLELQNISSSELEAITPAFAKEPVSVFSRRVAIRRAVFHQYFVSSSWYFYIVEFGGFTFFPIIIFNLLRTLNDPSGSTFAILVSLILLLFYLPISLLFEPWLRSEAFRLSYPSSLDIRYSVREIQLYKLAFSLIILSSTILDKYYPALVHTWLVILTVFFFVSFYFYYKWTCSVVWFGYVTLFIVLYLSWFNACILLGDIEILDSIYLPLILVPIGLILVVILYYIHYRRLMIVHIHSTHSFGPLALVNTVEKFFDDFSFLQMNLLHGHILKLKRIAVTIAQKGIVGLQHFYEREDKELIAGEFIFRDSIEFYNTQFHEMVLDCEENIISVGVQLDLRDNIITSLIFITSNARVFRFGNAESLSNTHFLNLLPSSDILGLHGSFDRYSGLLRSAGLVLFKDRGIQMNEKLLSETSDLNEKMLQYILKGDIQSASECLQMDKMPHAYIDHNGRSTEENGNYGTYNWTAITAAAYSGNLEMIDFLLSKGADINHLTGDKCSALLLAVLYSQKEAVRRLISCNKINVDIRCFNGWTALFAAAATGNQIIAEYLLDAGADATLIDLSGKTATEIAARIHGPNSEICLLLLNQELLLAVISRDLNKVNFCIDHGANINSSKRGVIKKHWTPLTWAVSNGDDELSEILLSRGADIRQKTGHLFSPFYIASQNGNLKMVKKIISLGVDVNEISGLRGWNALFIAAAKGYLSICEILVSASINVCHRDNQGHTALYFASSNDVIEYLRPLSLTDIEMRSQKLIDAIGNDLNDELLKLLDNRNLINIDFVSQEGEFRDYTPLCLACSKGEEDIIHLLLEYGCNPNLMGGDGFTPLYRASQSGCYECVKILLEKKASVDSLSDPLKKRVALHIAAANGYLDIVKLLLQHGANLTAKDNDGKTALDYAQGAEMLEFVRPLLLLPEDICKEEVLDAIITSNMKAFEEKVDNVGSSWVNYISKQGQHRNWTPLSLALARGNDAVVDSLLETLRGTDVNLMSADLYSPLYRAAEKGNLEAVEKLLKKRARINDFCGPNNWTALHVACANGFEDVIVVLLKNGADSNLRDKIDRAPYDLVNNLQMKERLRSNLSPQEILPEPSLIT